MYHTRFQRADETYSSADYVQPFCERYDERVEECVYERLVGGHSVQPIHLAFISQFRRPH